MRKHPTFYINLSIKIAPPKTGELSETEVKRKIRTALEKIGKPIIASVQAE